MQLRQRHAAGLEFSQDGEGDIAVAIQLLDAQVADAGGIGGEHAQPAALPYLHVDAVSGNQAVEAGLREVAVAHREIGDLGHPAGARELTRDGHHDHIFSWAPVISLSIGPERGSWQPLSASTVISSRAGAAMRRAAGLSFA